MNTLNPLQGLGLGYNHTFQDMKSDSTFRSYMNTDMQESPCTESLEDSHVNLLLL
jgi:hypothetical protein